MRSRASARLRTCNRWVDAVTVRTVPSRRCSWLWRTRRRWASESDEHVAISTESCTLLSVVLTPWPPGPDDFANRSVRSAATMTRPPGIPGPGAMVRSFIPPSLVRVASGSDPPCEIRVVYDHAATVDLQLDVDSPCSAFISDSFRIDGAVVLV